MTNAISVEGVSKRFRIYKNRNQSLKGAFLQRSRAQFEEFWALDDVSFEIPQGKTFGLLGHNGSGKSTLLKCIAKILTPDKGSISSTGRMAAMLEVGSGFHPELSGFIDQPVKNYSSGMYVRLGFSVSIHVEPDILLVDEVLAVGDMEFQNKCMDKFAQLKDQGRTVVVVSHGLEQMRTFCDQAAWLDHGTLVDVGGAAEVIDTYSDVAHHAVEVEGGGTRFGSGEAMIERIELLSSSGQPTSLVYPGDPVRLRLHYRANERIESPVFGASIDTREGVFVWGLHGMDACYVPTSIEPGTGHLDIDIPRLTFNPGAYTISAAIQNQDMTSVIDALQKARRFDVLPGPGMESGGLVNLGASFTGLTPARPMRDVPRRGAADYEHLARMQAQQADALENED